MDNAQGVKGREMGHPQLTRREMFLLGIYLSVLIRQIHPE